MQPEHLVINNLRNRQKPGPGPNPPEGRQLPPIDLSGANQGPVRCPIKSAIMAELPPTKPGESRNRTCCHINVSTCHECPKTRSTLNCKSSGPLNTQHPEANRSAYSKLRQADTRLDSRLMI